MFSSFSIQCQQNHLGNPNPRLQLKIIKTTVDHNNKMQTKKRSDNNKKENK